jgi:hypothetical protein
MATITLDYINRIQFEDNHSPIENYQALSYLSNGLSTLANIVREKEIQLSNSNIAFSMGGTGYLDTDLQFTALVPCYFSWFTVSLVNYVRLIGLFDIFIKQKWSMASINEGNNQKTFSKYCDDYVKEVIPDIRIWRNKISAHFAVTDPREDSEALLEYSIMNTVFYIKPYYKAGFGHWNTKGISENLPSWSLTETYEKLIPRYWKDRKLPALPNI